MSVRSLEDWIAEKEHRAGLVALPAEECVYPFNAVEGRLARLIGSGVVSYDEYRDVRAGHLMANRNLRLFEMAPRVFGERWGQQHLLDLGGFERPSRALDATFAGQYDLWCGGNRIEVKAARAVDGERDGPLPARALSSTSLKPFWLNFQQIKLGMCDAFVFIGVWTDQVRYWVMSSAEVAACRHLSTQHRGGIEHQLGIKNTTLAEFDAFQAPAALVSSLSAADFSAPDWRLRRGADATLEGATPVHAPLRQLALL